MILMSPEEHRAAVERMPPKMRQTHEAIQRLTEELYAAVPQDVRDLIANKLSAIASEAYDLDMARAHGLDDAALMLRGLRGPFG